MPRLALTTFMILACLAGGCIEFQVATPGSGGDGPGTSPPAGNGGATVVDLSVSNTVPEVNEEILLECRIVSGGAGDPRFAFQPDDARLQVDASAGRATLIVDVTDVGVLFTFTCTATDDSGTSEPSNELTILPVAPFAP